MKLDLKTGEFLIGENTFGPATTRKDISEDRAEDKYKRHWLTKNIRDGANVFNCSFIFGFFNDSKTLRVIRIYPFIWCREGEDANRKRLSLCKEILRKMISAEPDYETEDKLGYKFPWGEISTQFVENRYHEPQEVNIFLKYNE